MPAYLIAIITAHNLDWFAAYQGNVPSIIHSYGGKYLALAKGIQNAIELVEGTAPAPDSIVIFTFPSMDAIKNFLNAPEYKRFREARMAATESTFFAFENDDNAPQLSGQ